MRTYKIIVDLGNIGNRGNRGNKGNKGESINPLLIPLTEGNPY